MTDNGLIDRDTRPSSCLFILRKHAWRKALDSGLIVAVAFVDFRKAFDRLSVSHQVLLEKLRANFGICDEPLGWMVVI